MTLRAGLHWEPRFGTYERTRSEHDNATPPVIPAQLRRVAEQGLAEVAGLIAKNKSKPLPAAQFDICLANYYPPVGIWREFILQMYTFHLHCNDQI
jgi:hypothetical protein